MLLMTETLLKTVLHIIYINAHTFNALPSNSIYFFFLHSL